MRRGDGVRWDRRTTTLVGQNHSIGDPIITRRGGIQFRLSTDVAPGDNIQASGRTTTVTGAGGAPRVDPRGREEDGAGAGASS